MRHASDTTRARTAAALLGLTGLVALSACADQGGEADASSAPPEVAQSASSPMAGGDTASPGTGGTPAFTAALKDAEGGDVGTVEFTEAEGAMELHVQATGMDPGFYGLHVHAIGQCEPDSAAPDNPDKTGAFLSAGGHLGGTETQHPEHAGDLPTLLVQESGDGHLTFHTDRFTAEDLDDEDGSALMIHSTPDNYANIPERYAPEGPDEDTTKTGDAGDRLACGVVEAAQG
ncbi:MULTISPECIES: superoxide dismutase family protein [Micrococcaceae]|uniref:superoxide dismutase family protein n=2 Tax=Micrococcales TaxID=85006 RepID=UPI00160AEDC5|nr:MULTISPECIES: superoxide dismutase family protein [Micrococcaceae]MBB5749550.1 Cu-Zn family superoxide dismutase [Micrococcus sp. TA1]HRO31424.1 superoxide dismutase family protein [Citricoccus sp.]